MVRGPRWAAVVTMCVPRRRRDLQMVVPMLKKRKIQMKTGGSYGDDDVLRQAARRQFAETEE